MKYKFTSVATWLVGIFTFLILATPAQASPPSLTIDTVETRQVQVSAPNGERGAALAKLKDGRLLLGGGTNGSSLFLFDRENETLQSLGRVIKSNERLNDSRFAITDIAVLEEQEKVISLLISFPQYSQKNRCVSLVLYKYDLKLAPMVSVKRGKQWFKSSPCVPISAVQHAAGRIEVIDKKNVYLTTGDLGFPKIGDRKARGTLGSIYKVSSSAFERVSQGHRNPQGVQLIGKDLYISEHGPRGGDEINLVEVGKDYGWPFVTYGQPYGLGDYVRPSKTGTHEGFIKPLYYWVPSVAPTELILLPDDPRWGSWSGQLVMGTLRENALIFLQLMSKREVGQVANVNVGERIRDLEVGNNGSIIATTDSGNLLFIAPA
ncbi:MAG: PQQ-dependent sugar dehydrogenase [Candidatus Nanopelagicaceae bacterium]